MAISVPYGHFFAPQRGRMQNAGHRKQNTNDLDRSITLGNGWHPVGIPNHRDACPFPMPGFGRAQGPAPTSGDNDQPVQLVWCYLHQAQPVRAPGMAIGPRISGPSALPTSFAWQQKAIKGARLHLGNSVPLGPVLFLPLYATVLRGCFFDGPN